MKELRKILLTNWHYFDHVVIELGTLNFLTGQNAAGKSTIIDAIQVVMLGETRSHIFNKAANDKSERTIIGYLKGELGDDGDTGYRYLREGDFNSYIILEFYDTVKEKSFIAGVIFDVYGDATQKHNFFIADCPIDKSGFMKDRVPLDRNTFKSVLKHASDNRFSLYDSQNSYRQHLMSKCGNIKHKFFSLFKKAVPFSPISDIESFITEYITDIKGRPDVEEMQQNLRYYKRLERDAYVVGERIGELESIQKCYSDMNGKIRQKHLREVISLMGRYRRIDDERLALLDKLSSNMADIEQLRIAIYDLEARKEDMDRKKVEFITEKAESDIEKKLKQLDTEYVQLQEKLTSHMKNLRRSLDRVKALCKGVSSFNDEAYPDNIRRILKYFEDIIIDSISEDDKKSLTDLNLFIEQWNLDNMARRYDTAKIVDEIKSKIAEGQKQLQRLKSGIKSYPKHVEMLSVELKNQGIRDVHILSDVIDVNLPRWKNAIEGYLHTQKFYLLVFEDDYDRALHIYEGLQRSLGIHGVGLIDTEKLYARNPKADSGSLAQFIDTEHKGARLYVDYILGQVMACESVGELRRFSTSITDSCMVYHNFVARQIDPERWRVPYIGRKAIQSQIQILTEDLTLWNQEKVRQDSELVRLDHMCKVGPIADSELEIIFERFESVNEIKSYQIRMDDIETEKKGLDLSYLLKLEDQIKDLSEKIKESEGLIISYGKKQATLEAHVSRLSEIDIPRLDEEIKSCMSFIDVATYDYVRDDAKSRFEERIKNTASETIEDKYLSRSKAASKDADNLKTELTKLRDSYNRRFHMSHDSYADTNQAYDEALSQLKESKLPDYLQKIGEAKERTYQQFRDEFLAKLKENFDSVHFQIAELNFAIKDSPFGTDRFRFEAKPKAEMRQFYDMIMDDLLMGDGMSIMSYAFNNKHGEAIEDLFRMIVDIDDSATGEQKVRLEKNISYYTDYRSYLNFDLIVIDQNNNEQRLSKTLLKKSGGETQTPFYISVLASFAHMYRIKHSGKASETIRLIVFDEAFSKMDQQRIEESLKLLRRFELQAIISAPPDKVTDITPHVDQNLCVFRDNDISFVKTFSKKELLEIV